MDELFNAVLKPVIDAVKDLHPAFQVALVVIIIIITQGPKIFALRARWKDYRLNRSDLKYLKEKLEILKLHYEVELIKKEKNLIKDDFEKELFPKTDKDETKFSIKYSRFPNLIHKLELHIKNKQLFDWLKDTLIGRIIIHSLYILITVLAYLSGFITISVIFVTIGVEDFRAALEAGGLLFINLIYILTTSLLFYWSALFSHYRKLLKNKYLGHSNIS